MTEFLTALKADLTDRRLLPLLALAAVVLAAAIGYAVLGGGSNPAPAASPAVASASPATAGIAVTQTTPEKAVAEDTGGGSQQRHGVARNPFIPLPEAKAAATSASGSTSTSSTGKTAAGSTSTGSTTTKSGSGASSGSTEKSGSNGKSTPKTPTKPVKPQVLYHVAVLFGVIPAGVSQADATLTPFLNLPLLSPLPSAKQSLLVFRGVTAGGKSATFTLVSEAILHGNATCLPSAAQCQAIDLAPGQTEQLEYISPTGEVTVYELRIVSIEAAKASAAAVKNLLHKESKAGRELLRQSGLEAIPYLRNSTQAGVLVFSGHGARAARAHVAAQQRRLG